jgi:hypothetical protein
MRGVATFVVRVFVPEDPSGVPFCGIVERSGTGRAESFQSGEDLIQIVRHELGQPGPAADPTDPTGKEES